MKIELPLLVLAIGGMSCTREGYHAEPMTESGALRSILLPYVRAARYTDRFQVQDRRTNKIIARGFTFWDWKIGVIQLYYCEISAIPYRSNSAILTCVVSDKADAKAFVNFDGYTFKTYPLDKAFEGTAVISDYASVFVAPLFSTRTAKQSVLTSGTWLATDASKLIYRKEGDSNLEIELSPSGTIWHARTADYELTYSDVRLAR